MGTLRGYDYSKILLCNVEKDIANNIFNFSKDIEKQIERTELINLMKEVLSNNGRVYFLGKKNVVCGVIVIGYEQHLASEFKDILNEHLSKETKQVEAFVLKGLFLDDSLKEQEELIKKDMVDKLKQETVLSEIDARMFFWKEEIIIDKSNGKTASVVTSTGMTAGMIVGFMIGIVIYCITKDASSIGVGMCIGLSAGVLVGGIALARAFFGKDAVVISK